MGEAQRAQQAMDGEAQRASLEAIERAILQIGWLSQRQFMQLLDDERFRLTLPQFYTLLHLQQIAGECKMSDLAEATHLSAASLTGVVDRLLEKQLVERVRPVRDRRQVIVAVTPRGAAMIVAIKQARREQLQAALAHMAPESIETFIQLLDQVLEGMVRTMERGENGHYA